MNYNEVKGPNGLADFLLHTLSEDTKYMMYKDIRDNQHDRIEWHLSDIPHEAMEEAIWSHIHCAGYNLGQHLIEELVVGDHSRLRAMETFMGE